MANIESRLVLAAGAMASTNTLYSAPMDIARMTMASFQAQWSGTPNGTITIWVSNQFNPKRDMHGAELAAAVVASFAANEWIAAVVTGGSNPAGSASQEGWDLSPALPFRWVILRYVNASSTGTLNVWFHGKDR